MAGLEDTPLVQLRCVTKYNQNIIIALQNIIMSIHMLLSISGSFEKHCEVRCAALPLLLFMALNSHSAFNDIWVIFCTASSDKHDTLLLNGRNSYVTYNIQDGWWARVQLSGNEWQLSLGKMMMNRDEKEWFYMTDVDKNHCVLWQLVRTMSQRAAVTGLEGLPAVCDLWRHGRDGLDGTV